MEKEEKLLEDIVGESEEYDDYVPGSLLNDKGIPLLNDAIPLDEEILAGLEGEGPKPNKPSKKRTD